MFPNKQLTISQKTGNITDPPSVLQASLRSFIYITGNTLPLGFPAVLNNAIFTDVRILRSTLKINLHSKQQLKDFLSKEVSKQVFELQHICYTERSTIGSNAHFQTDALAT
jgi:hypothetical protein